ncbi:MAG: TonB family protein [Spirosomataceae bacterium]
MKNAAETPETLDEIVFEQRNKAYGAFELRQQYNRIIQKAASMGSIMFTLALLAPLLYAKIAPTDANKHVVLIVSDVTMAEPPKQEEVKLPEPPKVEPPQVETHRYVEPVIVPDDQATDEVLMKQSDLNDAKIGTENIEGISPSEATEVVVDESTPKAAEPVTIQEDDTPFLAPEQQAEFVGGWGEFRKFLEKNLKYPPMAQRSGVEGKVVLTFVVSKTGEISGIELLKGIGFGCDEEAVRVVKLMPHWSPGKQSGRPVPVKFTLPITFALQ